MIVVITAEAEIDLERIGGYIARDNPRRAETFVNDLTERCHALIKAPYAFALVPRYEKAGIRRRPLGSYLIFYRVRDDRIEVLRILHGAQDYGPILEP